jgi:hypothetical protein
MKLLFPFAIIMMLWAFCGLGDRPEAPVSNNRPADTKPVKKGPDREEVKTELTNLAREIAGAAKDGDVAFLAKITTDDFQLTDIDGKVQTKNKALADVKEERNIRSFEILDEQLLSYEGTSAVLTYTIKLTGRNGRTARAKFTDTFEQEDGRWLLKSQQQTLLK